ncbi:hypothetical protein [Actinoplanes sp. URMC 104]|uniref:hypothetical protein n=1 Tax=Actinoplanes sp. URMC 104 TaxID=3423409 RepID=UPI003F1B2198
MRSEPCVVCRHRDADVVCDDDRALLREQLTDIPRKLADLATRVMRASGGDDGPRVTATKVEADSPVNEHVLSLLAGGSEHVSAVLVPLVRRFPITTTVTVQQVVGGRTVTSEQQITKWFTEAVGDPDGPLSWVRHDDQIGVLPPREWLDVTVRAWRAQLGHHVPARSMGAVAVRRGGGAVTFWPKQPRPPARAVSAWRMGAAGMLALLSFPAGRRAYAIAAAFEQHRRDRVNAYLGLLGPLAAADRPEDPLLDDIETRFGEPPRSQAIAWDVDYLLTWLDEACDRDLGIAEFAGELATLTAELERALGEQPEQTWIGRCPAMLIEERDSDDGEAAEVRRRPCGAGLWHQPGWAQVPCPRCHATWDVRGPAAARTALQIRKVWPYDRRRRYTVDEIGQLPVRHCATCTAPLQVRWREATGSGEKTRTWQLAEVSCPAGHDVSSVL